MLHAKVARRNSVISTEIGTSDSYELKLIKHIRDALILQGLWWISSLQLDTREHNHLNNRNTKYGTIFHTHY
jgi:hypothetical protein